MQKNWMTIGQGEYAFLSFDQEVGTMHIERGTLERKAICQIGNDTFTIRRKGFWGTNLEVLDQQGIEVARLYAEKWFANHFKLEFEGKTYKIVVRNNPMAEYAIIEDNQVILAYGLDTNEGSVVVRINSYLAPEQRFFDFLLWYLFLPIATENMSDNLAFMMVLQSQAS